MPENGQAYRNRVLCEKLLTSPIRVKGNGLEYCKFLDTYGFEDRIRGEWRLLKGTTGHHPINSLPRSHLLRSRHSRDRGIQAS